MIRLLLALFFTFSIQVLFAQSTETKPSTGGTEQTEDEKKNGTDGKKAETVRDGNGPDGQSGPEQKVKAVPATKERNSKPAKVSKTRPTGNRPARNARPATRPVKPGNGRK